jgi:hypothetical protein
MVTRPAPVGRGAGVGVDGLNVGVGLVRVASVGVGSVVAATLGAGLRGTVSLGVGLAGAVSLQPAITASITIAPTNLTLRRYGGTPKNRRKPSGNRPRLSPAR